MHSVLLKPKQTQPFKLSIARLAIITTGFWIVSLEQLSVFKPNNPRQFSNQRLIEQGLNRSLNLLFVAKDISSVMLDCYSLNYGWQTSIL